MTNPDRESRERSAWLERHKDADSLVFDEATGIPHQAIYNYPASEVSRRETLQAFAEILREVAHDQA